MTRRTLLTRVLQGIGALFAAVVAAPALLYSLGPVLQGRERERWRSLGPLSEFPAGSMRAAAVPRDGLDWARGVEAEAVYVWRPSDAELVVYSRACTDLACPVNWDPGSEVFFCPCHGGIFAKDGARMAGPPKRPLDRYAHRVRGGVVEIDLASLRPMA